MPPEIEDAEVVSEGPKTPRPPPRVAELKPTPSGEAFGVFDGPVKDAKNATAPVDDKRKKARQAAKAARGGKKTPPAAAQPAGGAPGPAGPDPELLKRVRAKAKAQQLLLLYEQWQLDQVRGRYREILERGSLEQLLQHLAYKPQTLSSLSDSLGEGLYENGVELPWYVEFGSLFLADLYGKRKLLESIELKYQEHVQQKAATAPSSPAPKAA